MPQAVALHIWLDVWLHPSETPICPSDVRGYTQRNMKDGVRTKDIQGGTGMVYVDNSATDSGYGCVDHSYESMYRVQGSRADSDN